LDLLKKCVSAESRILTSKFANSEGIEALEGSKVITDWTKSTSSSSTSKADSEKKDADKKEGESKKSSLNFKNIFKKSDGPTFPYEVTFLSRLGVQTEKLNELKNTVAKEQKDLLYQMAEFQNLQRKQSGELDSKRKIAIRNFTNAILPSIDSLNIEVEQATKAFGSADHACVEGLVLTSTNAMKSLAKFDVKPLEAKMGDVFMSNKHEEVSTAPPQVSDDINTIKSTVEAGWMLKDEVLRKVSVEVYKEEAPKTETK